MTDEATTATTESPDTLEKDERDTSDYWQRWIKSATKAADPHWLVTKQAYAEADNQPGADGKRRIAYPIYYSSCKTLEPAYYAKTPKITTRRRFDINDPVALTGSLIVERLGTYLSDCVEFDSVMQACVADFIHGDKAAPQISYEQDTEPQRIDLMDQGGVYFTQDGQEWTEEVFQDEAGFFGKGEPSPTAQRVVLSALPYDEVLHTPDAKSQAEIREIAYYFCLDKDQAEKRFGDKTRDIAWKSKKDNDKDAKGDETQHERDKIEAIGQYVEGWEIWSKPNKRVYWLSNQYQGGFLDTRDDPYKLREFFPSPPFIISSKPSKSLYPTPAYGHLKPLINDMHEAAERFSNLLPAIQRKALVNTQSDELIIALNDRSGDIYVACNDLMSIVEKKGVESLIYWIPIQELVQAMTELTGIQDKFKNEFFEWFGIPDILRGATEPVESASAQQLKAEAAHDRFKWNKKLVAQMARDTLEMMVDLALGVFPDDEIARCVGFEFMQPDHQQRFGEALAMLRNDKARIIRLDIESDSLSFVDEQLRAQQISQLVTTVTQGLEQVSNMIQLSPQVGAVAMQALLLTIDAMPAGKDFHDSIKKSLEELIEQAKNPPEPGPPPPDYEMLKIQVEQQKAQSQTMKDQMDLQVKMREADRKDAELQLKAGTEAANVQVKQLTQQTEYALQQFMAQLEAQRVQIEQFKAQVIAQEMMLEEVRLAKDTEIEQYKAAVETAQTMQPENPQSPNITIINAPEAPKPEPIITL